MDDGFVACLDVIQGLIDHGVPAQDAIDALSSFVEAPENQDSLGLVTGFRVADRIDRDQHANIWSFGGRHFAVDFDSGV